MVTVTRKSASRRDVSRAALHCVGVSAVFMSLVAAMATGAAAADPAPPTGPDTSTGDGPLHDNSGDDNGPPDGWSDENDNGINDDDENPPDGGEDPPPDNGGEDPPPDPEAPRVAAPPDGGTSPVSPMHRRPRSSVSAQTTVIRRDSTPASPPPAIEPPPVRNSAPRVVEQSVPVEPQRLDLPAVPQAPRAAFAVELSQTTISPGGRVTATGLGCGPAAPVSLSVGHSPVGATLSDQQGTFAVALATGSLGIGHHDVIADCGETKNLALDVVLVSRVGTGAAMTTLILIFMVSGVWYFGHRILSPIDLRNRNA
jgi:hypothetical protein